MVNIHPIDFFGLEDNTVKRVRAAEKVTILQAN